MQTPHLDDFFKNMITAAVLWSETAAGAQRLNIYSCCQCAFTRVCVCTFCVHGIGCTPQHIHTNTHGDNTSLLIQASYFVKETQTDSCHILSYYPSVYKPLCYNTVIKQFLMTVSRSGSGGCVQIH